MNVIRTHLMRCQGASEWFNRILNTTEALEHFVSNCVVESDGSKACISFDLRSKRKRPVIRHLVDLNQSRPSNLLRLVLDVGHVLGVHLLGLFFYQLIKRFLALLLNDSVVAREGSRLCSILCSGLIYLCSRVDLQVVKLASHHILVSLILCIKCRHITDVGLLNGALRCIAARQVIV